MWIRKLLGLCQHKWVLYQEINIQLKYDKRVVEKIYLYHCEHCGAVKEHRVKM